MERRKILFRVILASALAFCGCITPPTLTTSQVLPKEDLLLVGTLKKGTDYAAGGRADLAEVEFRRALILNPNLSSIYNDLGYTLQAQDRLDESVAAYQQALVKQPMNLVARENLARVLYLRGDIEESIKQFETVLELYDLLPPSQAKSASGQTYTGSDLSSIYRNLASAYYRIGVFDEALCYSAKTIPYQVNEYSSSGQHGRMMLSLGMVTSAVAFLRDTIALSGQDTPAKLFFDYGVALYATGDYTLALEAFTRGLATKDLQEDDRMEFRALLLLMSLRQTPTGTPEQDERTMREKFLEDNPDFCEADIVDPDNYWPVPVINDVQTLVNKLCPDEK